MRNANNQKAIMDFSDLATSPSPRLNCNGDVTPTMTGPGTAGSDVPLGPIGSVVTTHFSGSSRTADRAVKGTQLKAKTTH